MSKGTYLGGSTIVNLGSDWMSGHDEPEPAVPSEKEKLAKIAKRAAGQANAKGRDRSKVGKLQKAEEERIAKNLMARRREGKER